MIDIIKIYNHGQTDFEYASCSNSVVSSKGYIHCSLNDLILEPKYKLIETLEKSEEYRDIFNVWIEGKDNIHYSETSNEYQIIKGRVFTVMSPQMILGYHIQFIKENVK